MKWHMLLAASLLAILGCGVPARNPTSTDSLLIYGRGADSTSLDPGNAEDGESIKVVVNVFDTLVAFAEDSADLVPSLATEWTESADRLEWTFKLRQGVRFHDGTDFNADAVVFTFERLTQPDHPHRYGILVPYRADYAVIEKVIAKDPNTVVFKLRQPSGVFLRNLSMFAACIVSPTAVMQHKDRFGVNPVGTGPFRCDEWVPQEKVTLSAFREHWRGPPGVDRVIFKPIPEETARLRQLQSGEIDMADELTIAVRDQVRADPNLKLLTAPGLNVAYFAMNNTRPPFTDVRVRRAVAHAIDKQEIRTSVYENQGEIAANLMPKSLWGHNDAIQSVPHDPEMARQLLKEANVAPGTRIQFWAMSNPRPYMPSPTRVATLIQQQLRKVGLELVIQSPPWSQYLDQIANGEHDACLMGWSTDNVDPDNFLYTLLDKDNSHPPHANNVCFYRSEPLHEILIAAQRESDQSKRIALYHEAQEIVHADAPMVPLMHLDIAVALRPHVEGYRLHPSGNVYLRTVHLAGSPTTGK